MSDSGDQSDGLMMREWATREEKRKKKAVSLVGWIAVMLAAHFLPLERSMSWTVSWLFCVSWSPLRWAFETSAKFRSLTDGSVEVQALGLEKQWPETPPLGDASADRPGLLLHLQPPICQDSHSGPDWLIVSGSARGSKERNWIL